MRKLLFTCIAVSVLCLAAHAQDATIDSLNQRIQDLEVRTRALEQADSLRELREHLAKIWKQKKYWTVGYTFQNLKNADDAEAETLKSSFAMSLQWGKTFSLHRKPIANMVKIGIDWNWVDWHYAKYKKLDMDEVDWNDDGEVYWNDNGENLKLPNLTYHQIDLGMAIGPSVQVTPFYTIGQGLEYLKVYSFFHVTPSFSGIILHGDKSEIAGAYNTFFSWGIGIAYKAFAIGFEHRWGKAKYNTTNFGDAIETDDMEIEADRQTKYKTTASKLTVSLRF